MIISTTYLHMNCNAIWNSLLITGILPIDLNHVQENQSIIVYCGKYLTHQEYELLPKVRTDCK